MSKCEQPGEDEITIHVKGRRRNVGGLPTIVQLEEQFVPGWQFWDFWNVELGIWVAWASPWMKMVVFEWPMASPSYREVVWSSQEMWHLQIWRTHKSAEDRDIAFLAVTATFIVNWVILEWLLIVWSKLLHQSCFEISADIDRVILEFFLIWID